MKTLIMNHGEFGIFNYSLKNALKDVTPVKVKIKVNALLGNFSNGLGLDQMTSQLKDGMLKELKRKLLMIVEVLLFLVVPIDLVLKLLSQEDLSCLDIIESKLSSHS